MKRNLLMISILMLMTNLFTNAQCVSDEANVYSYEAEDKMYEIVKENLTWVEAAACAVERGGMLIEINSQEEQDTLYAHILAAEIDSSMTVAPDGGNASYIWLGANDLGTEGAWIWDGANDGQGPQFWEGNYEGEIVGDLYNNWGDEPDDFQEQDGLGLGITPWPYGTYGQWNDVDAENTLYYIIEHPVDTTEVPTSITDLLSEKLSVYPNPTSDLVNISTADYIGSPLNLFDMQGRLLRSILITDQKTMLDLSDLNAGAYWIAIKHKQKLLIRN